MSPKAKSWLWMLAVIVSETSATSTLKMFDNSEGMTKSLLLALIVVLYVICYYSLSRAVKYIPVGLAYATWSGTGILMVSTLGMLFYGQHPDTAAMIGMAVIASGIVIMNLFSKMGSDDPEETEPSKDETESSLLSTKNNTAH
ncbi:MULTISPECIES: DMT family transporter [Providencia]|uniref:Methyl viologen resistance protein C n=3 Tax=Providencia TaxID=586 RepID=A0A264VV34_PRORE|nr:MULTISPECIES: multidrug efflux SMR transporter [Providencia]MRF68442.1 QacE family quaternary ammonium compound efflux SMR transporter [Escherichia coli]EFE54160.1 multidrug resistance protein, SMR family [Providencia rettgeri DSM 1131]EHZ6873138.1 multidrug efflux SMR transporter [Providencia rettgeri]MBG5928765.1 multidrug efflux SMR transporter [Providencia rettgeri]MBI6190547.1 multidrug efflux SMR transporter [Providencia rettgeri]